MKKDLPTRCLLPMLLVAAIAGCGTSSQTPPAAQQAPKAAGLQRITFVLGPGGKAYLATVGGKKLSLHEPDNPKQPTAWQGPLGIEDQRTRASCQADVSLITAAYGGEDAKTIIVVTYSGSLTYVRFLDLDTCKESYRTIKAYTEGVQVTGDRLTIQAGCECPGQGRACSCSAAQVFALDSHQRPTQKEQESLDLTRRALGVAFQGTRNVFDPKTPKARFAEN